MKNPFCTPKLRGNNCSRKSNRLTQMTLLDRFRQAVFRLIMLSAMSKATQREQRSNSSPVSQRSYYSHEHHHSEAVADCIEFIKRSAATDDGESSEVIFPVPVMWRTFKFLYGFFSFFGKIGVGEGLKRRGVKFFLLFLFCFKLFSFFGGLYLKGLICRIDIVNCCVMESYIVKCRDLCILSLCLPFFGGQMYIFSRRSFEKYRKALNSNFTCKILMKVFIFIFKADKIAWRYLNLWFLKSKQIEFVGQIERMEYCFFCIY